MKIKTFATVEADVEVDVTLDDVLNEMATTVDERGPKVKMSYLDQVTRIAAAVGVDVLADARDKPGAAALMASRLGPLVRWCKEHGASFEVQA